MLVRDRMSKNPITTRPTASVPDALKVMQGRKIRQLPVLEKNGEMVGIVSLVDLFRVSPSPATSLSVWEVDYLLEKITVEKVMTREVITVTEDTAVEEAGRILADNAISGLPVMRGDELVGIITESHLFHVLMELFGARRPGVRVMAKVTYEKGGLAKLSSAVTAAGGQFTAFGLHPDSETVTFKAQDITRDELLKAIEPIVNEVIDIRES
jgi:acetoin utilization protein AcuB